MSIIINKDNNGEYEIHSITHTPVNLNPFTNPSDWKDFTYSMQSGYMLDLCALEVEKEYDLNIYQDFEICRRIKKFYNESWGTSDKIYWLLKDSSAYKKHVRKLKLNEIEEG